MTAHGLLHMRMYTKDLLVIQVNKGSTGTYMYMQGFYRMKQHVGAMFLRGNVIYAYSHADAVH